MSSDKSSDKSRKTITLTDRAPITIDPAKWGVIARASGWHGGAIEMQANEEWALYVRQHDDGRAVVYGYRDRGNGGMPLSYRGTYGGELLAAGDDIPAAIRRVGKRVGAMDIIDECIADLPPVDLE